MSRRVRYLLFMLLLGSAQAYSQAEAKEPALKAAFIYNFTKYIDWENSSVSDEFVIGVAGSSPVFEALREVAKTRTVNNKKIMLKQVNRLSDLEGCNLVFIPKNSPLALRSVLANLSKGTVTVSEEDGYAEQGTVFNFVIINDKLKFESNTRAIATAGVKVSSQLLKLAIIVD